MINSLNGDTPMVKLANIIADEMGKRGIERMKRVLVINYTPDETIKVDD